jgi:hypothetical protein
VATNKSVLSILSVKVSSKVDNSCIKIFISSFVLVSNSLSYLYNLTIASLEVSVSVKSPDTVLNKSDKLNRVFSEK